MRDLQAYTGWKVRRLLVDTHSTKPEEIFEFGKWKRQTLNQERRRFSAYLERGSIPLPSYQFQLYPPTSSQGFCTVITKLVTTIEVLATDPSEVIKKTSFA